MQPDGPRGVRTPGSQAGGGWGASGWPARGRGRLVPEAAPRRGVPGMGCSASAEPGWCREERGCTVGRGRLFCSESPSLGVCLPACLPGDTQQPLLGCVSRCWCWGGGGWGCVYAAGQGREVGGSGPRRGCRTVLGRGTCWRGHCRIKQELVPSRWALEAA